MGPRGGTELLASNFQKYIPRHYLADVNLLISQVDIRAIDPDKINVLWHHLDTDQDVSKRLYDREFVNAVDWIVFVSRWQMLKHIDEYSLPAEKCTVIPNAIEPIPWTEKSRSGKLKLIYTSTPWRGLDVLVSAFKLLNTSQVELDVYSSTVIYGLNFMKNKFDWLFNICRQTPGINYRGYALNKAVVKACQRAHIFSYPSTFAETSCLAAIEAGAAGCNLVITDLGALPETCGSWGNYTQYTNTNLAEAYAGDLDKQITSYWTNYGRYQEQSKYFNMAYAWGARSSQWINFLEKICVK